MECIPSVCNDNTEMSCRDDLHVRAFRESIWVRVTIQCEFMSQNKNMHKYIVATHTNTRNYLKISLKR